MATINNLYIDQGTTFSVTLQVFEGSTAPLDITGYTGNAQIRKHYDSQTVAASFTTTVSDPANGKITLALTAGETANLKQGRYVYDVEIKSGAFVYRAAEGIVTVYPQVTR